MGRNPSDIDEVTQLYVDVGRHGWCDFLIVFKGELLSFRVSGVFTDMPTAILNLCNAILENVPLRVAFCDEPGGIVVELKPDRNQQHAMVFLVHEIEGQKTGFEADEKGKAVLQTKFKRRRLIAMLVSELWKTHKFLREPSYQIGRSGFPHHELEEVNKAWNDSSLGPSFLK